MPDLTAAELSIPAEQHPDPAKPLVIPVDSTVVGSTLRFIPWSVVGNPALLQLPPPPPGMQPSWVQIPQWVAISALLPFSEPEPAVATHFDRLSVLRLAVLAAAWRRILGALSDLGVFGTVHVDEDTFRTVCVQKEAGHGLCRSAAIGNDRNLDFRQPGRRPERAHTSSRGSAAVTFQAAPHAERHAR